jgi:hypothetical protein
MRPNKLEHLSMETLSSQVLEFNGKAKAAQLDHLSDASILGKFLVFPANVRLDWKWIASANTLAYFDPPLPSKKPFYTMVTRWTAGSASSMKRGNRCFCSAGISGRSKGAFTRAMFNAFSSYKNASDRDG